jgi:hypothetical protein
MLFNNKIEPGHLSANDGHHRKATNISEEMLHTHYVLMLSCYEILFVKSNRILELLKSRSESP